MDMFGRGQRLRPLVVFLGWAQGRIEGRMSALMV
jgi:hypothetical protein